MSDPSCPNLELEPLEAAIEKWLEQVPDVWNAPYREDVLAVRPADHMHTTGTNGTVLYIYWREIPIMILKTAQRHCFVPELLDACKFGYLNANIAQTIADDFSASTTQLASARAEAAEAYAETLQTIIVDVHDMHFSNN